LFAPLDVAVCSHFSQFSAQMRFIRRFVGLCSAVIIPIYILILGFIQRNEHIPHYDDIMVPTHLRAFVRRILCARIHENISTAVPARPTGFTYIGWLAQGAGTATVNDQTYDYGLGAVHFSGQLTTFDAEYTLTGPAVHYLAELQGSAAFSILDRDIGALRNQAIMLDTEVTQQPEIRAFEAILERLTQRANAIVPPQITEALRQIEARNGALSIADLALEIGMSDRQFHRQFSRVVGIAPKTFAVCQRVLTALKLRTQTPDMPISDVAYAAGFADQSHLTRMFKQYMRTTPAKVEIDSDGVLRSLVAKA